MMGILSEQKWLDDIITNAKNADIKFVKNTQITPSPNLTKNLDDINLKFKGIEDSLNTKKFFNLDEISEIKRLWKDTLTDYTKHIFKNSDLNVDIISKYIVNEISDLPDDILVKLNDNQISIVSTLKAQDEVFNLEINYTIKKYSDVFKNKGLLSLENYLIENGVPVEDWGKGYAKTVEHLLWEIQAKECNLIKEGGILIREIEFVMSEIFYKKGDDTFKLIEEKQIFVDGRERVRQKNSSVSEKIKIGEDPHESLKRGIEEELGLNLTDSQIETKGVFNEEEVSNSFPGLTTRYKGNKFTCYLDDTQYNPNGYKEVQKDKTTYFSWIKI